MPMTERERFLRSATTRERGRVIALQNAVIAGQRDETDPTFLDEYRSAVQTLAAARKRYGVEWDRQNG